MEDKYLNATCAICGEKYHVCNDCLEQKQFKPWRVVADTVEHYQIYMVIHEYTITSNKAKAYKELKNCNIDNLDNFIPEIKEVLEEILSYETYDKKSSKKK